MKETLEELKNIMNGILGAFIIDENGEVAAKDLPEVMSEKAGRMSKLIYYVTSVMKATRPLERIIIDSEKVKIIAMLVRGRILVVMADEGINLPLLKLVSNITASRLKEDKRLTDAQRKISVADINRICNVYDELFGVAAKRLYDVFGEEVAQMFGKKFGEVKEEHPKLLNSVGFGSDGRPKIAKIKMNATDLSKDELISGLEDVLVSMLESLKDTAGAMIADKAIDDIIRIKEGHKVEI